MSEVEIAGQVYRTGRLSARQQFHLMRKLAPVLASAADLAQIGIPANGTTDDGAASATMLSETIKIASPILDAISRLSDADADYVIDMCMGVCDRQQKLPGGGATWARVQASGSTLLMFSDIDLSVMLQLCWAVIQENFASFFAEAPVLVTAGAVMGRPS